MNARINEKSSETFHLLSLKVMVASDDNLCNIYSTRPNICNVEKMYELYYVNMMSKAEYEKKNLEGCKALQNRQKQKHL